MLNYYLKYNLLNVALFKGLFYAVINLIGIFESKVSSEFEVVLWI